MRLFLSLATLAAIAAAPSVAAASSLWLSKANHEAGMYADHRARSEGDLLTVIIDEDINFDAAEDKTSQSNSSRNANVQRFFYFGEQGPSGALKQDGVFPGVALNSDANFSGGGSLSNSRVVEAETSVVVVERLPNGNLIVEGVKQISLTGEKQYAVLRGVVRAVDIGFDNTVPSSRIANSRVEIFGEGDIAKAQKKGLLSKFLDVFNIW